MKKIEMNGKSKVLALNAVKGNQEGFKGIDKIRTGLKLLKKLEEEFPVEGEVPKELLEKTYEFVLEDVELSLLKASVDAVPWAGPSLTMVAELYDSLEEAQEVK